MFNKINNFLHRPNSLKGATGILATTLFVSNVLGLLRNIVLAGRFSPEELDIYFAGFQIPNLVFNLLVLGAVITAFIPIFSELITQKKNKEAWKLTQSLFNLVTIVLIILSIILAIFMPQLIYIVVPGFDTSRMHDAILVSRIMFLQTIIFGWSYIVGGVLNAHKRFTAYALAPLFYNIAIIIGASLGNKIGIIGLSWFVVIGALLHLLIQLIPAWKIGFRPSLILNLKDRSLKTILLLMIPRNLSLGITQINFLIFTAIASTMAGGSIAVLNLTNDFQTAPTIIFANSLAVALFPTLSDLANAKDWAGFEKILGKSVRMALFFLIPSAVIMIVLRAQIMRLYVGLGKNFDWETTKMAMETLAFFAVGVVPAGIATIYSRVFYALKNTKLPMYFSAVSVAIGIGSALLSKNLGVGGLALAFSITSIINAILLITSYKLIYNQSIENFRIIQTTLVSIFSSVVMAAVIWLALQVVDAFYNLEQIPTSTHNIIGLFIQTIIALAAGVLTYWLLAKLWQKDELALLHRNR